jgi:hypothetical protein
MSTEIEIFLACIIPGGILLTGFGESKNSELSNHLIFEKDQLSPSSNFTGKAWHTPLLVNDPIYNTLVGNDYFDSGARSNWHTQPSDKILIILDRDGYHQIEAIQSNSRRKAMWLNALPMQSVGREQPRIAVSLRFTLLQTQRKEL